MSTQSEYAAAALRNGTRGVHEHDTAELASRVAEHGWQLVTIQPPWSELTEAHSYAYFERRRTLSTASDRDLEGFREFRAAVGAGTGQPRRVMSWPGSLASTAPVSPDTT
jgi:hypothetical protein